MFSKKSVEMFRFPEGELVCDLFDGQRRLDQHELGFYDELLMYETECWPAGLFFDDGIQMIGMYVEFVGIKMDEAGI